jgi:geranylgeranyl diphosphate synthase type I
MPLENLGVYLTAIEAEMKATATAVSKEALAPYYGMIFYHLGWMDKNLSPREESSGKRLRPLLCLLSCEASGGDWRQSLPAAAAVELVHNFSLIHDDIEDNSLERRHRPTLWGLWGQAQGINAGDGLSVISRFALHRLLARGVPADKAILAFKIFDEACLKLTEGQYLDLTFEGQETVNVEMYLQMINKKTAALIRCATHLGALLGTEDQETIEYYRLFGQQLGLAFQIVDDILGIWGQEETTGKAVGEDIINKKKSLPIVYALEKGDGELQEIYRRETIGPQEVETVMRILGGLGAREYAHEIANQHRQSALDTLERTGIQNQAHDKLRELALFLVEREY